LNPQKKYICLTINQYYNGRIPPNQQGQVRNYKTQKTTKQQEIRKCLSKQTRQRYKEIERFITKNAGLVRLKTPTTPSCASYPQVC
jgi:hypothetical protein